MGDEKLTISWNDFEKESPNTFRNLFTEQDFRDVTLVSADAKLISAHKVVLSSSSPFFRNILTRNPHQSPLIFLKGVNFSELDLLVRFIYIGECEVAQEDLDTFLEVGKELEVNGLRDDETLGESKQQLQEAKVGVTENLTKDKIENNKFKCHSCEFKFNNRDYLKRHVRAKHTDNKDSIQLKFENQNDESETRDKEVATNDNATSGEADGNQTAGDKEEQFQEINKSSVEEIFQTLLEGYNSSTEKEKEEKVESHEEENLTEKQEEEKTSEENEPGQGVDTGEMFPCKVDKCSFVSTCKKGLKRHRTWKHIKPGKRDGRLVCDIGRCKFKSKLKSGLKRHKTRKHGNQTDIVSDLDLKILQASVVTVGRDEQHLCDLCEFKAASLTFLKNHKASIHSVETYSCNQCDFHSGWKSALFTHKITKHEGRKYNCDHCEYSTSYNAALKTHMLKKHTEAAKKDGETSPKQEANPKTAEPVTKTHATDLSLYPQIKCSVLNKSEGSEGPDNLKGLIIKNI